MKTVVRFFLLLGVSFSFSQVLVAQSAAGSSKEVHTIEAPATEQNPNMNQEEPVHHQGIPTPPHIEKLFFEGKVTEALSEFAKFKETQKKANPFHLLYLEMTIYEQAAMADPNNKVYPQKSKEIQQTLIEKYPNMSDTYLLQIDENSTDDQIIELASKAIELDPMNLRAYDYRGHALLNLKQIKEACADFEKLPWKDSMSEYWDCKNQK